MSQTLKGLHWDKIPGDNDDEVAARGILYLLIFQQLGQLLRWSWGYHVLLAPPEKFEEEDEHTNSRLEHGRYHDDPDEGSSGTNVEDPSPGQIGVSGSLAFQSGDQTPMNHQNFSSSVSSKASSLCHEARVKPAPELMPTPANGNVLPRSDDEEHLLSFRTMGSYMLPNDEMMPTGAQGIFVRFKRYIQARVCKATNFISMISTSAFRSLPTSVQKALAMGYSSFMRFVFGLWEFMNPPLWAMLAAIIVASVPKLQHLFFDEGSFIANSATRAVSQSGGVAVPLILVVLGANLARNTLPQDPHHAVKDDKDDKKMLIACLISRMLLPTIVIAPILALIAKYVPVSILDDPIFVIVCFLLTGAPSALQLAQICQINGIYMSVMSRLLFQSYVIWYVLVIRTLQCRALANNVQDSTLYPHPCYVCFGGSRMGSYLGITTVLYFHMFHVLLIVVDLAKQKRLYVGTKHSMYIWDSLVGNA